MFARFARSIIASRSSNKVRPASTAITRNFTSAATRIVSTPITGTSKRTSWFGFATLIITAPSRASAPPRLIASFVPSNASTARTVPFFTTTVCPMSSRAISFAIFFLASTKLCSRDQSRRRKTLLEKGRCRQKIDIYPGQFICNRRKDGFRVALFEFTQKHQRFQIRTQIKQVFRRDLSGHDRVMDFVLIKKLQEPIELSDAHPLDQIDMLCEDGIGLVSKRGRNYFFYTSFSRRISKQSWIYAVSGDNSQDV